MRLKTYLFIVILSILILSAPCPSYSATVTNYKEYITYKNCNSTPSDYSHGWRCIFTRTEPITVDNLWMKEDCNFYGLDVGGDTSIFSQEYSCKYLYLKTTNTLRVYRKFKDPKEVSEPILVWMLSLLLVPITIKEYKKDTL